MEQTDITIKVDQKIDIALLRGFSGYSKYKVPVSILFFLLAALKIAGKTADFHSMPVLSGSDKIPLCKL